MKGSGLNIDNVKLYEKLDTSFRIITNYHYQSDQILTRIDVKIGNEQYNVAFVSGSPIEPNSGSQILPEDDLITPKAGMIDCLNLKVPKAELLKALKELVSDMEGST